MNLDTRKRQRRGTSEDKHLDANRKLRHSRAFEGRNDKLKFVHAVEVASLEEKCVPVMGAQKEDVAIELQYPSLQPREKCASKTLLIPFSISLDYSFSIHWATNSLGTIAN